MNDDVRLTRRGSLIRAGGLLGALIGAGGWSGHPAAAPRLRRQCVHLQGDQGRFPDAVTDAVYRQAPYASGPNRDVRNADDSIYRNGGKRSQVSIRKNSAGAYVASIVMGVHRS